MVSIIKYAIFDDTARGNAPYYTWAVMFGVWGVLTLG
jgi:hypothetical protein